MPDDVVTYRPEQVEALVEGRWYALLRQPEWSQLRARVERTGQLDEDGGFLAVMDLERALARLGLEHPYAEAVLELVMWGHSDRMLEHMFRNRNVARIKEAAIEYLTAYLNGASTTGASAALDKELRGRGRGR